MEARPSAFFHQVSSASRMRVPRAWMAKSTMVVVPPNAAARVPVSKSSARRGAAERHVEVGVGVDAAGDHVHAGGVDDLVARVGRDAGAHFLDALAFDQDVGRAGVSCAVTTVPLRIRVFMPCHPSGRGIAPMFAAPSSAAAGRYPPAPW